MEPRCCKSNEMDHFFEEVSNSLLFPPFFSEKEKQDAEIKSKGIPVDGRKMQRLVNIDLLLTGI